MMNELHELIGLECELRLVSETLRQVAEKIGASVVGGFHITCSDEAEWECTKTFDQLFAKGLLPELKPNVQTPFRTMNLGARYEPGSIAIAEEHYTIPGPGNRTKLLLVKINSHVAFEHAKGESQYGWLQRYDSRSSCCGALMSMTSETAIPAVTETRKLFRSNGKDRLAMIMNESKVLPRYRALFLALTNARLQASSAISDIMNHQPTMPIKYVVVPCVTVNRPTADSEIVVGSYLVDATEEVKTANYVGLSDWPGDYEVRNENGRLVVKCRGEA